MEGIDHHCSYLHNCVGRRNYTSFMTFLISGVSEFRNVISASTILSCYPRIYTYLRPLLLQTLGLIYTVVFSALHFSIICSREGISFRTALALNAGSAVSFALGVVLIWPVLFLTGYHLRVSRMFPSTVFRHHVGR